MGKGSVKKFEKSADIFCEQPQDFFWKLKFVCYPLSTWSPILFSGIARINHLFEVGKKPTKPHQGYNTISHKTRRTHDHSRQQNESGSKPHSGTSSSASNKNTTSKFTLIIRFISKYR